MTALEVNVFTYSNPTYGSWEAVGVILYGEQMQVTLYIKFH